MPEVGSVEEKVKEVVADQIGCAKENIVSSSKLFDMVVESNDLVEILGRLEVEFHISISDEDGEQIKTIQDIVNCVKKEVDKK
jgi:acyl carrier protein